MKLIDTLTAHTLTTLLATGILLFACVACSQRDDESFQQHDERLAGETKAICYSGYRDGQHPDRGEGANHPTEEQILEDLQIIHQAGFSLLRLYDSQEKSAKVIQLIDQHQLPINVMLGIWLSAELSNHESCAWLTEPIPEEQLAANKIANEKEIQRGILLANNYPHIINAVNVGNEVLVDWNDHAVQVDTLIRYVRTVKSAIKQPVTVAENYEWWAAHGEELAAELDFIAIHIYPIWEDRDIDEGIHYSIENVEKVRTALPGHTLVISEAGWATTASEFGERASEAKQLKYYQWLMGWAEQNNITTFFFEAFDEPWKGDPNNPYGAEKHWGLWFENRSPKLVMQ